MQRRWKTILAVAVCACLAAPSFAGWVKLQENAYSYGNGGEFTVVPTLGWSGLTGLPSDLSASTFQSFCVDGESFAFDVAYKFEISKYVVASGQALTDGAAWLYSQFRYGTLPNYFVGDRHQNAGELQKAIWWFMSLRDPGYGAENPFTAMAQAALGNDGMGSGAIGSVRVLNLYQFSGGNMLSGGVNVQDQLTIIPLPAPAGLALVGLAGAGFVLRRWRC